MQIIIIHHNQYYIYKEYSKPKAHYYGNDKCTKIFFLNLRVHWIKEGNYEAGCIQNASTTTVVVVNENSDCIVLLKEGSQLRGS